MGADVEGFTCNVTNESEVADVIENIVRRFGSIEYLFNNAGYQGDFSPAHTYPVDDFRKVMETNVTGAFIVLKAVAACMVKAKFGRIVNMASRAGTFGPPNMVAYAASKAAVIGLTKNCLKGPCSLQYQGQFHWPCFAGAGSSVGSSGRKSGGIRHPVFQLRS